MQLMFAAEFAVLLQFQAILHGSLVFRGRVVSLFAFRARQNNIVSHKSPLTGAHDQD